MDKIKEEKAAIDTINERLSTEVESLKIKNSAGRGFSFKDIKKDADMIFYTGLSTKVFNCLFDLLEPHVPNFVHWRGRKVLTAKAVGPRRQQKLKIPYKDQFLVVLMRLRLGILMHDLAIRFNVSVASCSCIFTTWIKLLSSSIAQALLKWLPKDTIVSNFPEVFKDAGYHKTRCIIDCTEIYIKRPKSLFVQATT